MKRGNLIALIACAVVAVSIPSTVRAQADAYHFTGINFDFANPGARARGIGGAFVALADDSSAALANPAGLAFLDRQFSLELIHDQDKSPVGQVTQGEVDIAGVYPILDLTAVNDPYRVWSDSTSTRINNASFVLPIKKANLGLAVYYAALADLDQQYDVGPGLMCTQNGSSFLPGAGSSCGFEDDYYQLYTPYSVNARLQSELFGVGLGWALGDSLAIGGSVAYATTTFTGRSDTPGVQDDSGNNIIPVLSDVSSIDDTDFMFSVGLLYRGDLVGFGLNYRSEMGFEVETDLLNADGVPFPERNFTGEFRIPERFAAGIALFPGDHWVIATEYVRLPYSTIPKGMPGQVDVQREAAGVTYASADVSEIHIGAEYTTFNAGKGWSIRAGYWRDESHLIYSSQGYNDPIPEVSDPEELLYEYWRAATSLLYQKLDLSFDHFTAGFGASIGAFRVDLAVDHSPDVGTDFLVSGVFYF